MPLYLVSGFRGYRRIIVGMNDPLGAWEHCIVIGGLRILTIVTFLAFFGWALWHLLGVFS